VSEPHGVRRHGSERHGGEEDRGSGRLVTEGGLHGGVLGARGELPGRLVPAGAQVRPSGRHRGQHLVDEVVGLRCGSFTLCRHVGLGASLGRSHRPQGAAADGSEEGRGGVKPVTLPVGEAREVDLCRAGQREGEGAKASGSEWRGGRGR
jgi:hypothetical protein